MVSCLYGVFGDINEAFVFLAGNRMHTFCEISAIANKVSADCNGSNMALMFLADLVGEELFLLLSDVLDQMIYDGHGNLVK